MTINRTLLTAAGLAVVLSGCTLNEGDPQTTLCQKLTAHLMNAQNVQWGETSKAQDAEKSMIVNIRWNSQDANGTLPMNATCIYLSDENDAGEDFDVNVEDGYQSIPHKITINGQAIRDQDLHTSIQKVTGISIRETFNEDHLRKKAAEANQAVREGAAVARERAGEAAQAIKEGSEELRQKAGDALQKAGEQLKK